MSAYFAYIQVELFSTNIPEALNLLNKNHIVLHHVEFLDELSVRLTISRQDMKRLRLIKKLNQDIKIKKYKGIYWYISSAIKRPVLLMTILLLLYGTILLPSRILFVQVSGNEAVPENYILEQADAIGIGFWASRREVRSEQVKNDLLELVPQLKWAAVTTSGCTATIHVKEEAVQEKESTFSTGNIVAAQDGVVEEITVTSGNAVCKPGDVVLKGQILISGYTDCGITIQATQAQGEVYARTQRDIRVMAMKPTIHYAQEERQKTRYSVLIGKKLIKLYKDSGISDSTCVKIYTQRSVCLPGGLQLPVAVLEETLIERSATDSTGAGSVSWLSQAGRHYITGQMIAGCILSENVSTDCTDGACCLKGIYNCREMIGLMKSEEIIQSDAESD